MPSSTMSVGLLPQAVQVLLAFAETCTMQLHNSDCNRLQLHQRAKAQLAATCTYSHCTSHLNVRPH